MAVLYASHYNLQNKVYNSLQAIYPLLPSFAKSVWNHEAGPKTVFFWAPTIKWCLVMAGLADLRRPPENLSVYQVEQSAI